MKSCCVNFTSRSGALKRLPSAGWNFFFFLRFFQLLQSVDALFHGRWSADDERQKIHLSMARCPFVWPSGKCHSYGKQWPAEKRKCSKFLPPERIPSRFHTSCDATFPFDGQFVCLTTKNTPPDDSDAQLFLAERWHKRLESHSLIGHYARQMLVQFLPNGPHYCVDCISFPSKSRSAAPGGYFKLSTALEQVRPIFLYYVQNSVLIFENYFLYKTIFCVK